MTTQKVNSCELLLVLMIGSIIGVSFFILAPFIGMLIMSYVMMGEIYYVVAHR